MATAICWLWWVPINLRTLNTQALVLHLNYHWYTKVELVLWCLCTDLVFHPQNLICWRAVFHHGSVLCLWQLKFFPLKWVWGLYFLNLRQASLVGDVWLSMIRKRYPLSLDCFKRKCKKIHSTRFWCILQPVILFLWALVSSSLSARYWSLSECCQNGSREIWPRFSFTFLQGVTKVMG